MSTKLELLFNKVLDKSYQLRKREQLTFDGLEYWQPIKKILEKLDMFEASGWKEINPKFTKKIMDKTEYKINGHGVTKIVESTHFIIQQVRIPLKEKPTIKKIIQIALNIGQYKGIKEKQYFNFHNYINHEDIILLSDRISNQIIEEINFYLNSL